MTSLTFLLMAVLAALAWQGFRAETRRDQFVPCTAESAMSSLRDRLARGEFTQDEYHRLLALMR
jgi:uncharacterized membrane protein